MKFKLLISSLVLSVTTALVTSAQAEVVTHGTRFVYPADAREITVQVSSSGLAPSLVQVWIDEGDPSSTPENSNAPFVITPPLSRVDPQQSQSFRVLALPTAEKLSQQQESLFWVNVLDIPAKPQKSNKLEEQNYLQLAVRSRLKFFYRPAAIANGVSKAAEKIQWFKKEGQVVIKNPTPFFITISSINQKVTASDKSLVDQAIMLKPFSEQSIILNSNTNDKLVYKTINDFGSNVEYELKFN